MLSASIESHRVVADITPAAHRVAASPGRPLSAVVAPLLQTHVTAVMSMVQASIPPQHSKRTLGVGSGMTASAAGAEAALLAPRPFRPRILVHGLPGTEL